LFSTFSNCNIDLQTKIMQRKNLYLLVLSLVVALFYAPPIGHTVVFAKDTDPGELISGAVVNLYCYIRDGKETSSLSGSGVVISDRGIILTNAHVAQYFLLTDADTKAKVYCSVRTGSPAETMYTASVLYFPTDWAKENILENLNAQNGTGEHDFALMYITGIRKGYSAPGFSALDVATSSIKVDGDSVTLGGYPSENLDFKDTQNKLERVITSTTITNISSFGENTFQDTYTLASSTVGGLGSSGGPVLDGSNNVIGIITSKSTNKDSHALRAISIPYIDRMIQARTSFSLHTILESDLALRARVSRILLPEGTMPALTKIISDKE